MIKTWNQTLRDNLATMCLLAAMFFNPFGFDLVQYWLIEASGSLWKANFALYCIAGAFFGLYIGLKTKKNGSK
jgi:hypothetical protein